jgi:predicted ester cyclase
MHQSKNKEVVIGFLIEAYNNKNYDFVRKCLSNNYYDHSPAAARTNEQAIEILKIVHTFFPDIHVNIEDAIEENNTVAIRAKFIATHEGTFMGIEATNKSITWEALETFRLENNIIVESWGYWPDLDMYKSLGGSI